MVKTTALHIDPKGPQCSFIIISCPATAARLSPLLETLQPAISAGLIKDIRIIAGDDDGFADLKSRYSPDQDLWNTSIRLIWHILALNIYRTQARHIPPEEHVSLFDYILHSGPDLYFPFRVLTHSEVSVAMRHLHALKLVSKCTPGLPVIVIEDDAHLRSQSALYKIIQYMTRVLALNDILFFDLCDDYMPQFRPRYHTLFDSEASDAGFRFINTAITRTLMAYSISPEAAALIVDSNGKFAVPIDIHYQYLLARNNVPGYTLLNTVFLHASKSSGTGIFLPSVKQYD